MAIRPKHLIPVAGFLGKRALQLVESAGESETARGLKDRLEGAVEQLPERAVRRLNEVAWALQFLRPGTSTSGGSVVLAGCPATLHATGCVFPDPHATAPMPPQSVAAWLAAACSYSGASAGVRSDLRRAALRLWHQHASDCVDEARALKNLVGIARRDARTVVVERQDSDARLAGLPLAEFLRSSGFDTSELGDTAEPDAEAYRRLLQTNPEGAVIVLTDRGDVLTRLQRLRRSVPGSSPIIVWARQTWAADPEVAGYVATTVACLLRGGATAVVLPTGQLLGGPAGALAVAPLRWIETFERSQLAMSAAATAATAAVIDMWHQSDACSDIPLVRALRRDPRNVRTRAAQLALQLNGSPTIASAIAEDAATRLFPDDASEKFASTRLRIRHAVRPASRWARYLTERQPRVFVGIDDDSVLLDLKLIDPEHDARLAALLLGQKHEGG